VVSQPFEYRPREIVFFEASWPVQPPVRTWLEKYIKSHPRDSAVGVVGTMYKGPKGTLLPPLETKKNRMVPAEEDEEEDNGPKIYKAAELTWTMTRAPGPPTNANNGGPGAGSLVKITAHQESRPNRTQKAKKNELAKLIESFLLLGTKADGGIRSR
jgi:hypothetical protein